MKGMMGTMGVIGAVLLIGGIGMVLVAKGSAQMQIGGLAMLICALPAIMEVRFLQFEMRLRELEGKKTD